MGVSVSAKRRARALRKRYLDKERFHPVVPDAPVLQIREPAKQHVYPEQLNRDLHAQAKFFAEGARVTERLTERARWGK